MLSNQWLQNKSFIQWRLFPSEEDNLYWEKFIQDNPHFQNEIEEAIRILKSIKLNTQKLSPEEKQEIFALIQKNIEKKDKQRHFRIYLTVSAVACIVLFIIRKTKCFDFWERNVLFPKTKRSFFRTPKHPLPCPFPLNFSLLIITKKFGNLAKNRYICIV